MFCIIRGESIYCLDMYMILRMRAWIGYLSMRIIWVCICMYMYMYMYVFITKHVMIYTWQFLISDRDRWCCSNLTLFIRWKWNFMVLKWLSFQILYCFYFFQLFFTYYVVLIRIKEGLTLIIDVCFLGWYSSGLQLHF